MEATTAPALIWRTDEVPRLSVRRLGQSNVARYCELRAFLDALARAQVADHELCWSMHDCYGEAAGRVAFEVGRAALEAREPERHTAERELRHVSQRLRDGREVDRRAALAATGPVWGVFASVAKADARLRRGTSQTALRHALDGFGRHALGLPRPRGAGRPRAARRTSGASPPSDDDGPPEPPSPDTARGVAA